MFIIPKQRKTDSYGSGHYLASRGRRKHRGVDFCCNPNTKVFSSVVGKVTKLGYPYDDDLSFRYVEVTDINGFRHRVFYVSPMVKVGDDIIVGSLLGKSQKLGDRYPPKDGVSITEHFHYEIMKRNKITNKKEFWNPLTFGVNDEI